jgi:uncharacterized repeat protein (TIGR01451 family)
MNKLIRNSLSSIILLVLTACNLGGTPNPALFENSVLRMNVRVENDVTTFNRAGDEINIRYRITNTGTSKLAEPVIVTDPPRQVNCPSLTTVGNQDIYLDLDETVVCRASYIVTPSDEATGSITILASATVGATTSNQGRLTLTRGPAPQPSSVLSLTKSSSSQTYGAPDQTLTYTFTITNTGTTALGPAQFTITDNKLGAAFNCGPGDATLATNQSVSCSRDYKTTSADMALPNITNSATAAGAGQISAPASVVVTNLAAPATQTPATPATAAPTSNLTPGSTIQHRVAVGEWLIQIARCYGASFSEVRAANPQISDPDFIRPDVDIVTVPRIGSVSKIYKSDTVPCVTFHAVQSGDTWESLAQKYNADVAVLKRANPGGLVVGKQAKIPLNSAGGGVVAVTPAPGTTLTPTPTGTTAAPMRITFEGGSTTASRIGIINLGERIQYIVTAAQGQLLAITLQAPENEVTLGVNDPNGLALKTPDSLYVWTTTINTAGDHTINLTGVAGSSSKSYTLQVSLTTPGPTLTPTATLTNTPITPAP